MYTRLPAFANEILFSILHEHKNRVFNRIHIKFTPNLTRLSNEVNVYMWFDIVKALIYNERP